MVVLSWIRHYKRSDLPGDLIAGLTIAVMLVPQSLAYALLAGLPPIMGLYASILPVMLYGLLSSNGLLTFGPTAITSVMTLATISSAANGDVSQYPVLAVTLALALGAVYLLMALFRLGFITNLLSRPVLIGYVNAAALIIGISQIQHLLGVEIARSSQPHELLLSNLVALPQTNLATLLIGLGGLALLLYFKYGLDRVLQRFGVPDLARFVITRSGPLLLVLAGTLLVALLRLDQSAQVSIIGAIPAGFPALNTEFRPEAVPSLLLGAVAIAFVGFMEGISTAKSLLSSRSQQLDSNQELLAMGTANVASALTGGLPVTTSISRSAVNVAAGGRTGLSSIIAGALLGVTALLLTGLFFYLPRAVLAAIILSSVVNLIDLRPLLGMWSFSRVEPAIALVTMGSVFIFSVEIGILIGIGLMLALYVYRTAKLRLVELGRLGYSEFYGDMDLQDAATPIPRVLIVRIEESLYFANSQYLDSELRNLVASRPDIDDLILACRSVNTIDASAMQVLITLVSDLEGLGIRVMIAELGSRAYTRIRDAHLGDLFGQERFFPTIHEAVAATGQLIDDELPI